MPHLGVDTWGSYDQDGNVAESPTTTEVRLTGWGTDLLVSARALLFGEMVQRSLGVIEHYHSDLMHDATWMLENVTGPTVFYWGPRTYGTIISADAESFAIQRNILGRDMGGYRISLECRNGLWVAVFTRLA